MSKKCYRFFGGLLTAQEHWLNKMSEKGYRLIRAEKMLYEFEACKPDQVKYCVEFIAQKSKANASDYHEFLEGMGYKVFYKNINLNYSVGKVRLRPWAEKGGRIATNATTFNRELLIVEKDNDGKPFELHTSYEDKENYYRTIIGMEQKTVAFLFFLETSVMGAAAILFQANLKLRKGESVIREWESNMVKLWFVCKGFHNFIEYVFFMVCNG